MLFVDTVCGWILSSRSSSKARRFARPLGHAGQLAMSTLELMRHAGEACWDAGRVAVGAGLA